MIHVTDKHQCCGCGACVQRCPKQCISMKEDHEGFLYPVVDESVCIDCELCDKSCPIQNKAEAIEPQRVLAAKNKNEADRLQSSSGGVFIALAQDVIEAGGVVFGAVWDDKWEVKITYAETMEGVYPMMGSKYLQARTGRAYAEAERFLKEGREVLFTGAPCQIAGLHCFLRKEYENLLTVDFLCHGAPSPGVWRRYLKELMRGNTVSQSPNYMSPIEDIKFRDKRLGWEKYSFTVLKKPAPLSCPFNEDAFMRGFLANIYLRPSCYGCASKNGVSHSDLTIGDFWGINRIMPDFDDDKGISVVMINTIGGGRIFDRLKFETRNSSLSVAKQYNGGFNDKLSPHPERTLFFRQYEKGNRTIERMVCSILNAPLHRRAIDQVKHILRLILPQGMIKLMKKMNP